MRTIDERLDLWIHDLFLNNKITLKLDHVTNFKYYYDSNDMTKFIEYFKRLFSFDLMFITKYEEDIDNLLENFETIYSEPEECFECGKSFHYSFDGKILSECEINYGSISKIEEMKVTKTNCIKVNEYSVDIDFPTGELLLSDWFQFGSEILDLESLDSGLSINNKLGIKERTENYAKLNLLHMLVGNTSPYVYYKNNEVFIGINGIDNNDNDILLCENGKLLTRIITDLWWVSIVDVKIYKELMIKKLGEEEAFKKFKELDICKYKIPKGKYRCTYYYNTLIRDNDYKPELFIKMQKINEK